MEVKADVADFNKVTGGLKEVQAQAVATAAAVSGVWTGSAGQKITDTNVLPPDTRTQEQIASEAALNATLAERAALRDAGAAAQERSVALTTQESLIDGIIETHMERRVIMETQLEAAEARIAGNTALAVRLEREAEIRTRSLSIQRSLNVTTEESIALAERLVIAEEATAAAVGVTGVNMGKARAEALVLGRELAAGNVRASTLSSLVGSLGTTFTIAGIAAYEIFHIVSSIADEIVRAAKEQAKMADDLFKAETEWSRLAREAQNFGDELKLAEKMTVELAKVELALAEFRARDLVFWKSWADTIVEYLGSALIAASAGLGSQKQGARPFQDAADAEVGKREKAVADATRLANVEIDHAAQSTKDWAKAEADLPAGITLYTQKVSELQTKLDAVDARRRANPTDAGIVDEYTKVKEELGDATAKLNQLGDEQDKLNHKTREGGSAHRQTNELLREQANLMAGIRGQQQLVQNDPFLSVDQKNAQMIPLITSQIAALNAQIASDKNALKDTALDPAQIEQVKGKIQQADLEVKKLGQDLKTLSFGGGLKAELTAWVNSFGSSIHQVASLITGTLNTAISATSQAITGLIFKTGNWKQAFAQAAQAIVGNIIQILLQWVVSQTIMKALGLAGKTADIATTEAVGAASAAAWAPAATAASIATLGTADATGVAALTAAMASGIGIVTAGSLGGAAGGWYVDRGTHSTADDVPIRVSRGEGIINAREVARRGGKAWVDSLNSGVTRTNYATGGIVPSGGGGGGFGTGSGDGGRGPIEIHMWHSPEEAMEAYLRSGKADKHLIAAVNNNRPTLGLR